MSEALHSGLLGRFGKSQELGIDIPQLVHDLWRGATITGGLILTIASFGAPDKCAGIVDAATYYHKLDRIAAEIGQPGALEELRECSSSPAPEGVQETLPSAQGMTQEQIEQFWQRVEQQHLNGSQ